LKQLADDLGLSDKVEFIGHVEGAVKDKLYADAYWTFMPSHTENFGLVVLESLAQNTPVLASKESPWKILEDEKIGFWTDNSPETLAQKIDKIIGMPAEEYDRYRQRGRAFVEENFEVRRNIERWNDLYTSLAQR
jgi:glycosyltransferase involved in cell wall biosynthesis